MLYFVFTTYSRTGNLHNGKNKFFLVIVPASRISNNSTRNQVMKLTPLSQINNRRVNAGFTLIELLVVVAIIALLAGGSVAAYGKVMNMVKKNTSQKVCVELASAVSSYFADYERLPISATGTSSDFTNNDTAEDGEFLGILAAKGEVKLNARHINYIEGMQQAKNTGGKYSNGINFEESESSPTLTDPWGHGYRVVMDADYNGEIENPELGGSGAVNPVQKIRGKKCIVYGAGLDGNFETWSDNPKSW
jgi:prepilin-type N-terminal cleavage/methylation domain-containing protein